jgi:gamma-glutamyltranspeptidase
LWFGDEPNEAVQRTRLHHQWMPQIVYFEKRTKQKHIASHLKGIGHYGVSGQNIGVVQVIQIESGVMKPYSDRRKSGKPAGYNAN